MKRSLLILAFLTIPGHASAHDWFTDKKSTQGLGSCCGGNDCAEVPRAMIESGAVQPASDGGFDVSLTAAEAQHFNRGVSQPIRAHVPWNQVQPSESHGPDSSGYALCILGGNVRCFFAPQSVWLGIGHMRRASRY